MSGQGVYVIWTEYFTDGFLIMRETTLEISIGKFFVTFQCVNKDLIMEFCEGIEIVSGWILRDRRNLDLYN